MTVLSSMPFCPYNGRRVSLRYLPAAARYMTQFPGFWITAVSHSPLKGIVLSDVVPHRVRVAYPFSCRGQSACIIHPTSEILQIANSRPAYAGRQSARGQLLGWHTLFVSCTQQLCKNHIPPDFVVRGITTQRKPLECSTTKCDGRCVYPHYKLL